MNEVRPIHLPGASALAVVLQRTQAALAAWARDWVNDEQRLASLKAESADAEDLQASQEFEATQGARGCVWIRHGARDRASFAQAVTGAGLMPRATFADEWIADLVDQAWKVRNRVLCEALVGAVQSAPSSQGRPWPAHLSNVGSGAVRISCESLGLLAIADAGVWSLVPPIERKDARMPALVPLERAARRASLQLEVALGSVELDLPKVMDLRRGDVLRLPARIDQPFAVTCEGKPIARAMLGEAGGHKAIRLNAKTTTERT